MALWPPVFAGEQDVGQDLGLDCQPGVFPPYGRFAKMDGIPVDDDGGEQVEPGHAGLLALAQAVANFVLAPDPEREAQPVVSPAPHPDMLDVVVGQCVMAQRGGFVRGQVEQALADVRKGDTLVVPKLDRLARSVPGARAIADRLRERGVKLALGRALYDPGDPMGKMFFNILATFAEFEADLIRMRTREGMSIARARGNYPASSPNCPTDSSGSSAPCMPRAGIPSAILPRSSPSQDQLSIAHSTGSIPLSVRSCPLPE